MTPQLLGLAKHFAQGDSLHDKVGFLYERIDALSRACVIREEKEKVEGLDNEALAWAYCVVSLIDFAQFAGINIEYTLNTLQQSIDSNFNEGQDAKV